MKGRNRDLSTDAEQGAKWLQTLVDMTPAVIFVFREDQILFANRAALGLTGYSEEELMAMRAFDIVHPDYVRFAADRRAARQSGDASASRYEIKIVCKGGEERWLDLTMSEIELDDGNATVGTALDITERKLAEIALKKSESELALAQRAARSLSWQWDPATDALELSPTTDEIFGFPAREQIPSGEAFQAIVHPDDRERLQRALRRTLRGDGDLSIEIRVVAPNGNVRWLAEKGVAIQNDEGRTLKIIGAAHDITERKTAEEGLFQEKERALVTLASIAEGVIRTDADGKVDYLNPTAQRLTGWTMGEAYGRPVDAVYRVVDESGKEPVSLVARCLDEQRNILYPGDRHLVRKDGARFAVHETASPLRNREGQMIGAILVFKDLTRLRAIEREILHLASHDPLTGLINRREFEIRLQEALQNARGEGRSHALCYLDLDQFKVVNDTCGHAAGDQLILQIASLIAPRLGSQDVLARLGGDEFGILLRDRTAEDARALAEDLVRDIGSHRFSWQGQLHPTSASAGLIPVTAESFGLAALMSAADAACYVAKESGGGRLHRFEPGDTVLAERYGEMQWIARIHQAFDEGRFSIYHQEIRPLTEGDEARLVELFIRMKDESGELIASEAFIPAVEKYGLITSIDRWMIRASLEFLASSPPSIEPDLRIAINVSGQSLSEKGFLDFVVDQFERTGVEPARVHFEITETSAIADLPHALQFISALKGKGCYFVLDDFGKGLSSFAYLQSLPVDYLKIDGEFVRDIVSDPIRSALVRSIHEIGHVMGLRTIAEAVEDADTLEALRDMGVDYVQGYGVSMPAPLEPRIESGDLELPRLDESSG